MTYKTILPPEAQQLVDDGWTYLDVRTVPEFEAGHPVGAYNVPFANMNPDGPGMVPNDDFVSVVQKAFAADAKLVVGCAAGGRSMAGCEALSGEGFTNLANMHGGYAGARPPGGDVQPGWEELGYPTAIDSDAERTYEQLRAAL